MSAVATTETSVPLTNPPARERVIAWVVGSLLVAALKWWTLDMPANWDEVWAVLPGALELRDNGFDIPALLNSGGYNQYGPATHGASPVTWLAGAVFTFAPADQALRVLHLVHFLIGGFVLSEIYRFVRGIWSQRASIAFAAAMAIIPVISVQLGAVYLEIPLLAAAMLSANAFIRERFWWAAGWAAVATAVKPTGIYVAIAIGIALLMVSFSWKTIIRGLLYGAPAIAIALWHLVEITAVSGDVESPSVSILSSLGTAASMPELSLPLLLSLLAFLAIRRGVDEQTRIRLNIGIAMELAFAFMFVVVPFVGLRDRLLPRYVVAVLPFAAFVALASLVKVYGRQMTAIFATILATLMILNTNGALTLRNDANNVVLQERTNAYADLLLLQRELLTIGLERPEPIMVASPNHWFRVQHPELGYVDEVPAKLVDLGHANFDPEDPATYPDSFLIFHTESYENSTRTFAENVAESPDFKVEIIERSRGFFTLELLVVNRVADGG